MNKSDWETPFQYLEWGFLLISLISLTISDTYQPSMGIGAGFLLGSNAARWIRTGRFSRPTPIDIGVLVFFISSLIAYIVAPDQAAATHRLFLLLAAFSLYYTVVNSRSRTLHQLSLVIILGTVIIAVFFISQNHWTGYPTRFGITRLLGRIINRLTPDFGIPQPHWNVLRNLLASVLGIVFPIAVYFGIRGLIHQNKYRSSPSTNTNSLRVFWIGGALLLVIILFTKSRSPWLVWLGLAGALGWWVFAQRLGKRYQLPAPAIFWGCIGVVFTFGILSFIFQPQLRSYLEFIPGPNTAVAREEIYTQSWLLAQDTPFTGGGLAAFPALYSTYIRVSPFNVFLNEDTGNNTYLNLLVEQGWLGLWSFIAMFLTGLFLAPARIKLVARPYRRFVIAGIFGTGFILLQGFIHATFVSTRIIPFFLLPLGFAFVGNEKRSPASAPSLFNTWKTQLVILLLLSTPVVLFVIRSPTATIASWYANQGAIQLARSDLNDFPAEVWDDGGRAISVMPGEDLFERSLTIDPNGGTAHHRLGLISMLRRDYQSSSDHLEMALISNPTHRGVQKNLGYSYAWEGKFEQAAALLLFIPEVKEEFKVYEWWWQSQDQLSLSGRAAAMDEFLDGVSN